MARKRLELHEKLCDILGSRNCYFRPPTGLNLKYPCILYDHTNNMEDYADNHMYRNRKRYSVTIVDEDPDSEIPDRLQELSYCSSDRNYISENLNHFVYTLYW